MASQGTLGSWEPVVSSKPGPSVAGIRLWFISYATPEAFLNPCLNILGYLYSGLGN